MLRRIFSTLILVVSIAWATGCSETDLSWFQKNRPDPDFTLFDLFNDYPALSKMWDTIDGDVVNNRLGIAIRDNEPEFLTFNEVLGRILDGDLENDLSMGIDPDTGLPYVSQRPVPLLLKDLQFILQRMHRTLEEYHNTGVDPDVHSFWLEGL